MPVQIANAPKTAFDTKAEAVNALIDNVLRYEKVPILVEYIQRLRSTDTTAWTDAATLAGREP